jgi:excisionase family DNA binding protein
VAKDRITVQEAARRLGVKDDAVRKRIQRGSIGHDKDSDGRVYVYLDATHDESQDSYKDTTGYVPRTAHPGNGRIQDESQDAAKDVYKDVYKDALVEAKDETIVELRDQVGFLRRELERKDTIIMSLTQRIPELEAPRETAPEATGAAESDEGATYGTSPQEAEDSLQRRSERDPSEAGSWWRRFFGLE